MPLTDPLFPAAEPLDEGRYTTVLQQARAAGFQGFGGACAHAAVALNAVLFDGRAQLVGCFNEAFQDHGVLLGHVAVRLQDPVLGEIYLDADGQVKAFEAIESWGMLDEGDVDHQEQALALGFTLDEHTAATVATFEMEDDDVLEHFGEDSLGLVEVLRRAVDAWQVTAVAHETGSPAAPAIRRSGLTGVAR